MITETITYFDFDENERTDTLNFHLTEAVMLENLDIVDGLQDMVNMSAGPARTLTTEENQKILNLLKRFMSLSYGVRLPDGGFDQDDPVGEGPIWKKFKTSSAYNAFVLSLFQPTPSRSAVFMYRVLPASIRGELGDLNMDEMPEELRQTLQTELAKDKKPARLPKGTRIIDDVPVTPALQAVPDAVDETDFDALMAEAEADEPPAKKPITQKQYDLMKSKLAAKPAMFEDFLTKYYVPKSEGV